MSFKAFTENLRKKFSAEEKLKRMNEKLLNVKDNEQLYKSMTAIQNEIGVKFNTKVIAVSSVDNDVLATSFAKSFAETFGVNGSNALVIDANMYNPSLAKAIGNEEAEEKIAPVCDKVDAITLNKEVYPSEVYKEGKVHKLIKDNLSKYEHIIVLVPSVKEHKEVALLKDVVNSIILITVRNSTKKADIFYALQFFSDEKLPLAKAVVLK